MRHCQRREFLRFRCEVRCGNGKNGWINSITRRLLLVGDLFLACGRYSSGFAAFLLLCFFSVDRISSTIRRVLAPLWFFGQCSAAVRAGSWLGFGEFARRWRSSRSALASSRWRRRLTQARDARLAEAAAQPSTALGHHSLIYCPWWASGLWFRDGLGGSRWCP